MALEREMETYRRELPNLLAHEGKFVVIREEEVAGVWDTFQEAMQAGYERYDLASFMVKKIEEHEKPVFFSRGVRGCQS